MAGGSYGGRIGLVWETSRFTHNKRTYVARVVQKGTSLKTPGPSFAASAPDLLGVMIVVLWLPIRALGLLGFRNSFKVGLVEVDGQPDEERIVEQHTARGEKNAIALAKGLAAQGDEAGQEVP